MMNALSAERMRQEAEGAQNSNQATPLGTPVIAKLRSGSRY